MSVHTIFVPTGWSVEQVWEAIKRGEVLVAEKMSSKQDGQWVNVDDKGKIVK